MKKLLFLLLLCAPIFVFAQNNPIVITNPYLFQRYITIHDSINVFNNGHDTIAGRRYVREFAGKAIKNQITLQTSANFNIDGNGISKSFSTTGENSFGSSYTSNSATTNVISNHRGVDAYSSAAFTTSAYNGFGVYGVHSTVEIGATNTQNWTALDGALGSILASVRTASGATGTLTSTSNILLTARFRASGMNITEHNFITILPPTGSGATHVTDEAGIFIYTLSTATNSAYIATGIDTTTSAHPLGNWNIWSNTSYPNNLGTGLTTLGSLQVNGLTTASGGIFLPTSTPSAPATNVTLYSSGNNRFGVLNTSGFAALFNVSLLSTTRTITFPNESGTILLTTDTSSIVQTISNFFPKGDTRYLKLNGSNANTDLDLLTPGYGLDATFIHAEITNPGSYVSNFTNHSSTGSGIYVQAGDATHTALEIYNYSGTINASIYGDGHASFKGLINTGTTTLATSLTGVVKAASGVISASLVGISDLSATGTPSSTTYLRGDNTWATVSSGGITALTGDGTASGSGSVAFTLATVNSNVGSFGSSTAIPSFTVNAKGLITAASTSVVIAPAGTLTGTTLASNVVTSSLTSASLAALTATNTTLTFSGSYNGNSAQTVGLNLGNANTWTGAQIFNTTAPTFGTMTAGSVLFAGTGGLLSQNNSKLFWDNTNNRLGMGTTTPYGALDFGTNSTAGRPFWMMYNDGGGTNMGIWRDTPASNVTSWLANNGGSIAFGRSSSATTPAFGAEWARFASTGNFTIGSTISTSLFNVGSSAQFQVNSSGAVVAATGITSSGAINFSGLTASKTVFTDGSKNLTNTGPGTVSQLIDGTGALQTIPTISSLGGIPVTVTSVASGDGVRWNGSTWINSAILATSPLHWATSTWTMTIDQSNTSTSGYLSSTDWNTFNGKLANAMTTLGDIVYGGASGVQTRLPGNTTSTQKFLTQTGTGSVSAAPAYFDLFGTANSWSGAQTFNSNTSIITGGVTYAFQSVGANFGAADIYNARTVNTVGYTVATLPASPAIGMRAYVTDALTPSFLVVVVGGGSTVTPVFYNGTNWVAD